MYDLRSDLEHIKSPQQDFTSLGINYHHNPVFSSQDYSPEALLNRIKLYSQSTKGFIKGMQIIKYYSSLTRFYELYYILAYMSIIEKGTNSLNIFLRSLITHKSPHLIHCTAGKDRTGVFIAILLLFLDVPRDIVVRDYALTNALYTREYSVFFSCFQLYGLRVFDTCRFGRRNKSDG
jgi:hypothetical protein